MNFFEEESQRHQNYITHMLTNRRQFPNSLGALHALEVRDRLLRHAAEAGRMVGLSEVAEHEHRVEVIRDLMRGKR
jgi:hypothetical protein